MLTVQAVRFGGPEVLAAGFTREELAQLMAAAPLLERLAQGI